MCVSHGQNLINQQNIRIHIDCNGKCQTHIHTGRIGSHRIIDVIPQARKSNDLIDTRINLFLLNPKIDALV